MEFMNSKKMTPDQLPLEEFLEEADDLIQELESSLLELESNLDDRSIIDRIFRPCIPLRGSRDGDAK